MKKIILVVPLVATILSGCWTFNESPYPETAMTSISTTTNCSVRVAGFESFLTTYETVEGFNTVYVPSYYGHHYYSPGHYETVHSVTHIPQLRSSDIFLQRARDAFEQSGFILGDETADYTVEVTFSGPNSRTEDNVNKICWMLFSVFFCDYEADHWSAKLRIRDTKSGKLLFHHDYVQDFETNVFGLIPLFSIANCEKTTPYATQTWCLAALTDRAVADATAFFANRK